MKRRSLWGLFGLAVWVAVWGAGATATVTWAPPTQYTDGSPLPAGDIKSYTIKWTRPGNAAVVGSVVVPAPALTVQAPTPCGDYQFTASVTTTATAKFPNETSSEVGPLPYASGIGCAPNPPAGVAVH